MFPDLRFLCIFFINYMTWIKCQLKMQSIYILQWRYIQLSVNEQTRSEGFMTHLRYLRYLMRYLRYLRFAKTVPGADRGSATGADHMSWYPPWSHPWSAPHTPPGSSPGCVPRPPALIDFVTWLGSPPGVDLIRSSICSTVLSLVRSCIWGSGWLCRTCRRGSRNGPRTRPNFLLEEILELQNGLSKPIRVSGQGTNQQMS